MPSAALHTHVHISQPTNQPQPGFFFLSIIFHPLRHSFGGGGEANAPKKRTMWYFLLILCSFWACVARASSYLKALSNRSFSSRTVAGNLALRPSSRSVSRIFFLSVLMDAPVLPCAGRAGVAWLLCRLAGGGGMVAAGCRSGGGGLYLYGLLSKNEATIQSA